MPTAAQIDILADLAKQGGAIGIGLVILVVCAVVIRKYIVMPLLQLTRVIAEAQRDTSMNCLEASREARETTNMLVAFMDRNGIVINRPDKAKGHG